MCVGYMYTVEWRLKSHISPQYPSSDNVVKVLPWTPKKSLKKKEFVSIVFLNCSEKKVKIRSRVWKKKEICFNSLPKLFRKKKWKLDLICQTVRWTNESVDQRRLCGLENSSKD